MIWCKASRQRDKLNHYIHRLSNQQDIKEKSSRDSNAKYCIQLTGIVLLPLDRSQLNKNTDTSN